MPTLLAEVNLASKVITGDAMHCQQVLATLNTAVIGLIRHHGEHSLAAVQRRFRYQWDQALHRLSGQ